MSAILLSILVEQEDLTISNAFKLLHLFITLIKSRFVKPNIDLPNTFTSRLSHKRARKNVQKISVQLWIVPICCF